MKICVDIGHGLGNKKSGVFDPGAVAAGVREADIVLDWGNELRGILMAAGHKVVRTRVSHTDPCPITRRAPIAKEYGCQVMISLHCNAANGRASGTETFYRTAGDLAKRVNDAAVGALGTKDRGIKKESESQHTRLAVMAFQPCVLLEIGFIDNADDREKMLDPVLRRRACGALAEVLTA